MKKGDTLSLPRYWEIKKLGEVCDRIIAGGDKPKEFSKFKTDKYQIPIYANGEKNKGLYGFTNVAKVIKHSITISARGTIGYSEIRKEPFTPIVRLIVLNPNENHIKIEFLKYVVSNMDFLNTGTSIPQLTVPMVKNYTFPIPPLPEQNRIVAILDKAFTVIDKAKANTEKNLANAKELFESYLNGIFENPGEDWEEERLGKITSKIGSGATPLGGQRSYKNEGISLIRSLNIHDDEFKYNNLAFIDESQAEKLSNVSVESKDVLLNITGASIARCNIAPDDILPARVNQHVSIIRLCQNTLLTKFLHFMLISKPYKDSLLFAGEKNGATRQALTKALIENYSVSYPDIRTQKKILKNIDNVKNEALRLKSNYQQKITTLDELKKSILQKAFVGEL